MQPIKPSKIRNKYPSNRCYIWYNTQCRIWSYREKKPQATPMRLFIALEVPKHAISELERLQQHMRQPDTHPVKWVNLPHACHLTLQFLGETPDKHVPDIKQTVQHIADKMQDIFPTLCLAAPGAFPNRKRPTTLWVGVDGEIARLQQIQQTITKAMQPFGFEPEKRPFHAHLTLGRVQREAHRTQYDALTKALNHLPHPDPISWQSGPPILFQSTLRPTGARYTPLTSGTAPVVIDQQ